jgi:hypothetical protein
VTTPDPAPEPGAGPIALARDDSPIAPEADRVEQAGIGGPLAVGLASILTARYHQPLRRWLRRASGNAPTRRPGHSSPALRGPHRRV